MENKDRSAFSCVNDIYLQEGLTKREYFAAKAMQGILSNNHLLEKLGNVDGNNTSLAVISYRVADTMLNIDK